jgi:hypothetical protein
VYLYVGPDDFYASELTLNKDNTFEFNTSGCFTSEHTKGKWRAKGNAVYLYSDSLIIYNVDVYDLNGKYIPTQKDYIIEIVDENDKPIPNIVCSLIDSESSFYISYSDANGICKLKATKPTQYEIKVDNLHNERLLWKYIDERPINYRKIKLEINSEIFFDSAEFEIHEKGLQGNNSITNLFYTKRH